MVFNCSARLLYILFAVIQSWYIFATQNPEYGINK